MCDAASGRTAPPLPGVLSIVLANDRRELEHLGERIDRFAADCRLPPDEAARVNLILDELVTNTIKYGYDDRDAHQIHVTVEVKDDLLIVSVDDDGRPFNPLEVPAPALDLPIEERPVGGLGVFIVRSLADVVEYRRQGTHNIVTLTKKLQPHT